MAAVQLGSDGVVQTDGGVGGGVWESSPLDVTLMLVSVSSNDHFCLNIDHQMRWCFCGGVWILNETWSYNVIERRSRRSRGGCWSLMGGGR